jgi:hypothetical protein
VDVPPATYKGASLFINTCFEEEPGFTLCVWADDPRKPQPCVYILSMAHCDHPLYQGGHWVEVLAECTPKPPPTYEEEVEEFGI